jgi:AraC-like DNA-binding protein
MNSFQKKSLFIKQSLIFNSFDIVGDWWNFKEINSPFSRIYLITEGEGWVFLNNQEFHLTPGKLFLIPKFTFHSYKCKDRMGHFYYCFLDEIIEGVGMYDLIQFNNLVDAKPEDYSLFSRLNELNPNRSIINPDPATYDNKETIHSFSQKDQQQNLAGIIETQGIMLLLTSRFINEKDTEKDNSHFTKGRLNKVNYYIDQNLHNKITLADLANQACLSADYFSSVFNEIMGIRPMEYVIKKRIERAQMLLLTTNLTISQIAEKVGISNNSYFSTLFKKYSRQTPEAYQKLHQRFQEL